MSTKVKKDEQIKSKERVKDLAEVYTPEFIVNDMMDLIPLKNESDIIFYRYLEPSCGNGNFLIEILNRKLDQVVKDSRNNCIIKEYLALIAISKIHGVDICPENISESIERLFSRLKEWSIDENINFDNFLKTAKQMLKRNIVVGDFLNKADQILFTDYVVAESDKKEFDVKFERHIYCLEDMLKDNDDYSKRRKMKSIYYTYGGRK